MSTVGADLISGTQWDDWLLAVVGILVAVTTLAALAHKPPLVQIGHFIGWVFGRLIGEPIARYGRKFLRDEVRPLVREEVPPLVREEVEAAVEPIRDEQTKVANDLREHMGAEGAERAELLRVVSEHVQEDRDAFAEIKDWRDATDLSLRNIQQGQTPH